MANRLDVAFQMTPIVTLGGAGTEGPETDVLSSDYGQVYGARFDVTGLVYDLPGTPQISTYAMVSTDPNQGILGALNSLKALWIEVISGQFEVLTSTAETICQLNAGQVLPLVNPTNDYDLNCLADGDIRVIRFA